MDQQEIDRLIQKWLDGKADDREKSIVNEWYRSIHDASIELPFVSAADLEATRRKIFGSIEKDKAALVVPLRTRVWKVAAAAAIMGAIGLTAFFVLNRFHDERTSVAAAGHPPSDAAPGSNKAILKLSNGKIIALDNLQAGVIGTEGSARISKSNDGLVYHVLSESDTAQVFNTMSTPKGGQYQLKLPDGTKVWLNAASSITYPTVFRHYAANDRHKNERLVEVTGEAYFEVARDPVSPFRVKVNDLKVEVLGTQFDINAYSDRPFVSTSLLQGKVQVFRGKAMVSLRPRQQAQAPMSQSPDPEQANVLNVVNNIDGEEVLAWKNGLFHFNNADVNAVMNEIARWYDLDVVFEGPKPDQHYSGKVSRDLYASQMFEVIQKSGVHLKIDGKKLIIMQ